MCLRRLYQIALAINILCKASKNSWYHPTQQSTCSWNANVHHSSQIPITPHPPSWPYVLSLLALHSLHSTPQLTQNQQPGHSNPQRNHTRTPHPPTPPSTHQTRTSLCSCDRLIHTQLKTSPAPLRSIPQTRQIALCIRELGR